MRHGPEREPLRRTGEQHAAILPSQRPRTGHHHRCRPRRTDGKGEEEEEKEEEDKLGALASYLTSYPSLPSVTMT